MTTATLRRDLAHMTESVFRAVVIGLAVYGGLDLIRGVMAQDDQRLYLPSVANAAQVESLEGRVAALEFKLQNVTATTGAITVTGANLWVVNGTGATTATNALGNVIIGYNEKRTWTEPDDNHRTGSHMLVLGRENNYTSAGGMVAGRRNSATGPYASVVGGWYNSATGEYSSVTGGAQNYASGAYASITGGHGNRAMSEYASVSGGAGNTASAYCASVSGGGTNEATGSLSSIGGGELNKAAGRFAAVSGGRERQATGEDDWRAGELFQEN